MSRETKATEPHLKGHAMIQQMPKTPTAGEWIADPGTCHFKTEKGIAVYTGDTAICVCLKREDADLIAEAGTVLHETAWGQRSWRNG